MSASIEKVRANAISDQKAKTKTQQSLQTKTKHEFFSSPGISRPVNTLGPPIRQTASIFKQPVAVHRNHEKSEVRKLLLNCKMRPKPTPLFWERRLENLHACDADGNELGAIQLPRSLKPIGTQAGCAKTAVQSIATALHLAYKPVVGQTGPKSALERNPSIFIDPRQPLIHAVTITENDIRNQDERVLEARKKLEEALNSA